MDHPLFVPGQRTLESALTANTGLHDKCQAHMCFNQCHVVVGPSCSRQNPLV
jgi:hypothetical protein